MKNKITTFLWAGIIATAVYILGTVIACIISGDKTYYFCGLIIRGCIHPVWCIISVLVFVLQTVLVTVLLAIDAKNKTNVKRDLIASTVLGLVCLVLCLAPSAKGMLGLAIESLDEPKCTVCTDNGRSIVIKDKRRLNVKSYEVYYLNEDASVSELGRFQAENNPDIAVEWGTDTVTISYSDGSEGEMEETFSLAEAGNEYE